MLVHLFSMKIRVLIVLFFNSYKALPKNIVQLCNCFSFCLSLQWRSLDISGIERRRLCCSVLFHLAAALCVIWSLCVLIERAAEDVQRGRIGWFICNNCLLRFFCKYLILKLFIKLSCIHTHFNNSDSE